MAQAIPGYVGQVSISTYGGSFNPVVLPCSKINWNSALKPNFVTTAAGQCYPNVTPGLGLVSVAEFFGPWRDDFNPFTSVPVLQIGQTVQAQFSIWASNYDAYSPSSIVITSEWATQTDKQGFFHLALAASWKHYGIYDGGNQVLVRTIAGDNQ